MEEVVEAVDSARTLPNLIDEGIPKPRTLCFFFPRDRGISSSGTVGGAASFAVPISRPLIDIRNIFSLVFFSFELFFFISVFCGLGVASISVSSFLDFTQPPMLAIDLIDLIARTAIDPEA